MNPSSHVSEFWTQRYGENRDGILPEIEGFLTHRSVRKYSDKEVSREIIEQIVAAGQSASTSSNLQLFSLVSVQDPVKREAITELCSSQDHVRNAPWFFAVCADHFRLRSAAQAQGMDADGLDYAECFILSCVDASLAAERMVCAAEALGLGTCYIGALRNDPEGVSKLLLLPEGVFGLFGICIGYPHESLDTKVKPRIEQPNIWFEDSYDSSVDTVNYNSRMSDFFAETGQDPKITWLMRSSRRLSVEYMTGREKLKDYLATQGFWRR